MRKSRYTHAYIATSLIVALSTQAHADTSQDDVGLQHKPQTQESVQAVYRQQNALFKAGQIILQPGISYAYSDSNALALNGFLALGAIFLGQINVSKVTSNIETLSLQASYAPTDNTELSITLPYLARQSTYESVGVNNSSLQASDQSVTNKGQMGDVSAALYYQFSGDPGTAAVIWNLTAKAPTGRSPYGIPVITQTQNNNLSYPSELPTGNGVWSVSTGLSIIKSVSPAILFGSINYTYNIPRGLDNISSTTTAQPGEVAPGNSVIIGGGTAFALNQRISLTLSMSDTFVASTSIEPQGSGWQTVVGSSGNAGVLNLGLTYARSRRVTIVTNLGVGLTKDAPNMQLSFTMPTSF
ncbi:MAG TPA: hypothetical protein VMV40_05235 [Acidiferrobacter sp.]|nr:hypothetical protein [Acidiferrobacter sp.]